MKQIILSAAIALYLAPSAFAFGNVPAQFVQPTPPTAAMIAHECKGPDGIFSVFTRGTCPHGGGGNAESKHGTCYPKP